MDKDVPQRPRPRCRSLTGVRVVATGSYVPEVVVTNDQLHERLGFDSEWIVKRTGILERRHALPQQATSDLCYEAARRCIHQAGVRPADIDLLLLATFTPDMAFPSTACLVQDRLQLNCPAVDLQAACAGFMYALITGAAYVVGRSVFGEMRSIAPPSTGRPSAGRASGSSPRVGWVCRLSSVGFWG